MKVKSFFLLLVVLCAMSSCFNYLGTHTTPQMLFGHLYVNPRFVGDSLVSAKDTLYSHFDMDLGMEYVDSMQLGDTVMFTALFSSDMNNLVSVSATYDTTKVSLWYQIDMEDESQKNALTSGSKPEKGLILFNPMYNLVAFPVCIAPLKTGQHIIKIAVTSDSQYPTSSAVFTLPVR